MPTKRYAQLDSHPQGLSFGALDATQGIRWTVVFCCTQERRQWTIIRLRKVLVSV